VIAANCCVESECKEPWNAFEDTQVVGGVRIATARSVAECQKACELNSSCTGLDWDSVSAEGHRCWLHGPWSGTRYDGSVPGVTHYDINRRTGDCRGEFLSYEVSVPQR